MKKIFITLLVLFSISSFAQNHYLGLKGGVNIANISGDNIPKDASSYIGFSAGLSYDFNLKNNILLGADLLYDRKGYIDKITFTNEEGVSQGLHNTYQQFNFVSLPIKVGYSIGDKLSAYAYFGIVPSYLINASYFVYEIDKPETSEYKHANDWTEHYSKFELSGLVEVGANYLLTKKFLITLSGNYMHGFNKVEFDSDFVDLSYFHNRFNISLGIKYALKSE